MRWRQNSADLHCVAGALCHVSPERPTLYPDDVGWADEINRTSEAPGVVKSERPLFWSLASSPIKDEVSCRL